MINDVYTLTPNGDTSILSWVAGSAAYVSFVLVDGHIVAIEYVPDSVDRTMTIPLDSSRTGKIEIHDLGASDTFGGSIISKPNTKPLLQWDDVSVASEYRIYTNDVLISSFPVVDRQPEYTMVYPGTLDAGWQGVRIEAVDVYGDESTRANWMYYVLDLPAPKKVVSVAGGTGTFTLTMGAA